MVNRHSAYSLLTLIFKVDYIELEKITKMKVPGHGDKTYEFGALWEFAYKIHGSGNARLNVLVERSS